MDSDIGRDGSVLNGVSDDEARRIILRLMQMQSVFMDLSGEMNNMIRVLEILYGVKFESPDHDDVDDFRKVVEGISPEDATRLDPSYVEEIQEKLLEEIDDMERIVETESVYP